MRTAQARRVKRVMILFESVSKKYRGTKRPALDRVSLNIDRGEFVFIVGASGSGKSSCLRLILREEQPSTGRIHVLGHDLGKISNRKVPYFRRNLGVVFQDFRLLTNKTVYDNVAFSLQVIGKSRGFIQEAVPDVLEMVGLGGKAKRFPHELSGGEQQRVAIARAIVNKPAILLADEPTGNLDPATSLGIMQLLRAINASGTTVVMATHEATFVDIMQQRVIELSQGIVVRDEQRGGYGETASIDLGDLTESGVHVLHTSEDQVRATLAADVDPIEAPEGQLSPEELEFELPAAPEAVTAEPQATQPETEAAPAVTSAPEAAPQPQAQVTQAAAPILAHERETATPESAAHESALPAELDLTVRTDRPEADAKPKLAPPPGSYAEALGVMPDDQTDVGPVR